MSDTNNAEQSNAETQPDLVETPVPEDPVVQRERAAFNRYVQDQGQKIPENFKSADDWFNSLSEARKQYTQARQEIASLKKQYNEGGVTNPNFKEPEAPAATKPTESPVPTDIKEELLIPGKSESKASLPTVTAQDWERWGLELDATGEVSQKTRESLKQRLGVDDVIVEQLVKGRQALMKQSYEEASSLVGGSDNLKRLFKWAQETLTKEEIDSTNKALRSPAYKSVLTGLHSRYSATHGKPSANADKEPKVKLDRVNQPKPAAEVQVFKTRADQNAALGDPRYRTDPKFRAAVETMVVNTSRYGFKQR